MGNLLGKSKSKVRDKGESADDRQTSSAPARLEGLDGTMPGSPGGMQTSASFRESRESPNQDVGTRFSPSRFQKEAGVLPSVASDKVPSLPALPQAAPRPAVRFGEPDPLLQPGKPSALRTDDDDNQEGGELSPKKAPKKIDFVGEQTDGSRLAADLPAVQTEFPEEVKPWLPIFGEHIVKGLTASDWKTREQSILSIVRLLENAQFVQKKDPVLVWKFSCEMLTKILRDKVAPIFFAGLTFFTELVTAYCNILSTKQLQSGTDTIVPLLIHRCGNLNSRIHETSMQAIMHMTGSAKFGCAYIGPFALAPLPKKAQGAGQTGQYCGRLDLIYHLLITFRSTQGLPVEDVFTFSRGALELAEEKVRSAAIKVVAELYRLRRMAGDEINIERYLPGLKPALVQVLEKRFAEVAEEVGHAGNGISDISAVQGVKIYAKNLPPLAGAPMLDSPGGRSGLSSPAGSDMSGGRNRIPAYRGRTPPRSRLGGLEGDTPATPSPPKPRMGFAPRPPSARPVSARLNPNPNFGKPTPSGLKTSSNSNSMAFTVGEEADEQSTRIGSPGRFGSRKKPQTPQTPTSPAYNKVLDDAEEQLIEYILDNSTALDAEHGHR